MRMMEVAVLLGIAMLMSLQFVPAAAQQDLPGVCWKNIGDCRRNATTGDEFRNECCPVLVKELVNATDCFCSAKPILDQNPSLADGVSQLLTICNIGANFSSICPGSAPSPRGTPSAPGPSSNLSPMGSPAPAPASSVPCWGNIRMCISGNIQNASLPQFNTSSPLFNATEFLCCSLVQQTAVIEKPCFCGVTNFLQQNPSETSNVMQVIAGCGVADSVASLNVLCGGGAPSSAPTQMMQPLGEAPSTDPIIMMKPPPGSMESFTAMSPESDGNKTESTKPQPGAANKIMVAGSLSSVLVFFTYFLF